MKINDKEEKNMCKEAVSDIRAKTYSIETVGEAAGQLLKEYSSNSTVPIVKIVTDAGFKIFSQDMPKNIGGYIVIGDEFQEELKSDKIIVVNSNEDKNRQRFSLAHEFGHFLLDPNAKNIHEYYDAFESDDNKNELESLIDKFAAELLMPTELFENKYNEAKNRISDRYEIIKSLSSEFLVPFEAVRRRIEEIGG